MRDLRDLTRPTGRTGTLEAIYLRPARDVPAMRVDGAEVVEGRGLVGDRTADRGRTSAGSGKRQVTLLQAEHVPLIGRWTGHAALDAAILRRNLVVAGLNLAAARPLFSDQSLVVCIGEQVMLVVTGECAPCSKMEDALGPGGYNAVRGHGGFTARVLRGGSIRVGDSVFIQDEPDPDRAGSGV